MVLVSGGAGYIGSHTAVELLNAGFDVLVADDLSNSDISVMKGIAEAASKQALFEKVDFTDKKALDQLFDKYGAKIAGIIHFAAFKAVGESVEKPLDYYRNNLLGLINLLQCMGDFKVDNLIFSSSCTVYGQADKLPISEEAPIKPAESPYGNTKQVGEEIIKDFCSVSSYKAIALRYFNPIGAHPSIAIGELPKGTPQNLVPFITQTAAGLRPELRVFGDDYPTPDGTCIRDYIHVVDLAKAHVAALSRQIEAKMEATFEFFNVGTGKGSSVMEVIKTFEKVSQQSLPYTITDRRAGDVISAYADTTKANEKLGWKAESSLEEALLSAWKWEKKIRNLH